MLHACSRSVHFFAVFPPPHLISASIVFSPQAEVLVRSTDFRFSFFSSAWLDSRRDFFTCVHNLGLRTRTWTIKTAMKILGIVPPQRARRPGWGDGCRYRFEKRAKLRTYTHVVVCRRRSYFCAAEQSKSVIVSRRNKHQTPSTEGAGPERKNIIVICSTHWSPGMITSARNVFFLRLCAKIELL